MDSLQYRPATPDELAAACLLLYAGAAPDTRLALAARLAADIRSGARPASGLWVARGAVLAAAAWAELQPGALAVVQPPQVARGASTEIAARLLARVEQELARGGARLAQALLAPDQAEFAALLAAHGYSQASRQLFLTRAVPPAPGAKPAPAADAARLAEAPPGFSWREYRSDEHQRWRRLLAETFVDSRDCPWLDEARDASDTLAGFAATGVFSPQRWKLLVEGAPDEAARDRGCVLVAEHPAEDGCELLYLGLAPAARGRGLGRWLLDHALELTRAAGRCRARTAVDEANEPALALYRRAGFVEFARADAWLKRLAR